MLLNKHARESCSYVNTALETTELPDDPSIRHSSAKKKKWKRVDFEKGQRGIEARGTVNLPPGHGSILKGLSL